MWSLWWRGDLLPPCMCWLHDLGVLQHVGMNIIHAIKILTASIGKGGIEAAVEVRFLLKDRFLLIPGFPSMLEHPVDTVDHDLTFFTLHRFPIRHWDARCSGMIDRARSMPCYVLIPIVVLSSTG